MFVQLHLFKRAGTFLMVSRCSQNYPLSFKNFHINYHSSLQTGAISLWHTCVPPGSTGNTRCRSSFCRRSSHCCRTDCMRECSRCCRPRYWNFHCRSSLCRTGSSFQRSRSHHCRTDSSYYQNRSRSQSSRGCRCRRRTCIRCRMTGSRCCKGCRNLPAVQSRWERSRYRPDSASEQTPRTETQPERRGTTFRRPGTVIPTPVFHTVRFK